MNFKAGSAYHASGFFIRSVVYLQSTDVYFYMGNNNSVIIAVLVVVVIAIVGWLAYKQGYLGGKDASPSSTPNIQINY